MSQIEILRPDLLALVMVPVVGWQTPHEKTLESIRLLGEKVLPLFRS